MAYLVVHTAYGTRRRVAIDKSAVMGRAIGCQVWIDDPKLSRYHCRLVRDDNRWSLFDLNSANGTYIEGRRINEEPIGDNASFEIGDTRLVFCDAPFFVERPSDPFQALLEPGERGILDREAAAEDSTVVGLQILLTTPIPRTEAELLVPPRRVPPRIPLPFTRPRPRPIVYDDQGSSIG
jgi:pSer/pThr/pTyr-binding forkhead associated (FHA) protein